MHLKNPQEPVGFKETLRSWCKASFGTVRLNKELFFTVLFVFSLAIFIHYREVRVESLQTNVEAEKYVLAQVGFEFPDVEATILLKQESMRDIGKIYRLDDKLVLQKAEEVERGLITNPEWREHFPLATFEMMYSGKEAVRDELLACRFVDARTYQKMKEVGFPLNGYFVFETKDLTNGSQIPDLIWHQIQQMAFPQMSGNNSVAYGSQYIINQYHRQEGWNFYEDLSAQNAVRQLVKIGIPLKRTKVEAGSRIINAGEKVTPRHVEMMKAMKRVLSEQQNLLTPLTAMGSLLMAAIFTLLGGLYFRKMHSDIWHSFQKIALLATIMIVTLSIAKLTEYCVLNKVGAWADFFGYPIFIPFASLLVTLLLGCEVALVVSGFLLLILSITLSMDYDHFLIVNLTGALVTIFASRKVRRRKEIFEVLAKVWITLVPAILAFHSLENNFWSIRLFIDLAACGISLIITAVLVISILPILETAFGVITDMMLIEYIDPNHPLLRRLSVEAPGTYQHSLVVAAISEEAALAIGANGIFCRVATLYHDIGKLSNPHYFTENQFAGLNIHQLLTPLESAQVIIGHVNEGAALAEKYGLPQSFIDIIFEHHGTTSVYCFYRAQMELMRGDKSRVDESKFRYKGPKPHSKESAIIMIGDTVEAAFRSLDEVSEKHVTELVDRLVAEKVNDGQFDECELTFEEIGRVKKAMIRTLLALRHSRTKYPEALQLGKTFEQVVVIR